MDDHNQRKSPKNGYLSLFPYTHGKTDTMIIKMIKPGWLIMSALLSITLLTSSCQKMELQTEDTIIYIIDGKPINTAHFDSYLQQLNTEDIQLLLTAAYENENLHPYLRDFLLGEVIIAFDSVLQNCFVVWREKTCSNTKNEALCKVIEEVIRAQVQPNYK